MCEQLPINITLHPGDGEAVFFAIIASAKSSAGSVLTLLVRLVPDKWCTVGLSELFRKQLPADTNAAESVGCESKQKT